MGDWTTWTIIAGALAAFVALKRISLVSSAKGREFWKAGAIVIDVRSREEFLERHLPGVLNIPLGDLSEEIARVAADREKTLLLHCLSGGRSGLAKANLRRMGYRNVYNLGSYARAESILKD